MELSTYSNIQKFIVNYKGPIRNYIAALKKEFPDVSKKTLSFLVMQLYPTKKRKWFFMTHNRLDRHWHTYWARRYWHEYRTEIRKSSPGVIVRMAKKYKIAPCMLAKIFLIKYSEQKKKNTSYLELLRNPSLIDDRDLAYEVFLCNLYDNFYSLWAADAHMRVHEQYKVMLHQQLKNSGVHFKNCVFYDLIEIPVAIDGFVVNWIVNMAIFATQDTYNINKPHFFNHWSRMGRGLVIYWFGYINTILADHCDDKYIIRDCLPSNITSIEFQDDYGM